MGLFFALKVKPTKSGGLATLIECEATGAPTQIQTEKLNLVTSEKDSEATFNDD